MRCDQFTRRDEQCERNATWLVADPRYGREGYCTQHANEVDPSGRRRRLGIRWQPIARGATAESVTFPSDVPLRDESYPQEPGVRDDNGNLVDGQEDNECQGHPAGPFGATVYCDGSCRVTKEE